MHMLVYLPMFENSALKQYRKKIIKSFWIDQEDNRSNVQFYKWPYHSSYFGGLTVHRATANIHLLLIASLTAFLFHFISSTLCLILSSSSDFKLVHDTLPCFLYSLFHINSSFFLSQNSQKFLKGMEIQQQVRHLLKKLQRIIWSMNDTN